MRLGGVGGWAVVAAVVTAMAGAAAAQTLTRGPFIQNPQALPTSATFVWWTDVAGDSTVEYGLTPSLGSSLTVPQVGSCDVGAAGTCHTVTLTGLNTGSLYYYRLRTNGAVVQNTTYFNTLKAPTDPGDILFTVIGDWGQGTTGQAQIANLQNAANVPMIITVGDNSYPNGSQSDLDNNAMAYYKQPLQRAFYFPTLGNHDLNAVGGASGWANSAHIKTFVLPTNSPEPERYYWWEDGDALFLSVDSDGCCSGAQTNWMQNLLSTSPRKWKFVFYHHTAYSCANGIASIGSDSGVRNTWGPVWERNQVDIVFHGHDHIYERTKFMDQFQANGSPGSDGLGTVYVMSGGGGATLDDNAKIDGSGLPYRQPFFFSPKENCFWLANNCPGGPNNYCSFDRYQYTSVVISGNTLTLQAIDNSGSVFDTFTITKLSDTPTPTPTATPLPPSPTATETYTPTWTVTATPTATATDTGTPVNTATVTLTPTNTRTATVTSTSTGTATASNTPTRTTTATRSMTPSVTLTPSYTITPSRTVTATPTGTALPSATPTPICPSADPLENARLDVGRNLAPSGDESLKVRAEMLLSQTAPAIDPAANGFTLVVLDNDGAPLFSRYVPPGASPGGSAPGWRSSSRTWKFQDKNGTLAGGITKLLVKKSSFPGHLKVKLIARAGAFQVPLSSPGLTMMMAPGTAATAAAGQCAQRYFAPSSQPPPNCRFIKNGDRVSCK